MELVSIHNHSGFCGHGAGAVEEYVCAAAEAGITTMAMTEHYPLSPAFDANEYLSMPMRALDEYSAQVNRSRDAHPEIEVLLGCEFDWLGEDEDRDLSAVDFGLFEVVLGSVHFIDRWAFDDPACKGKWEELGADYIWRRYFEIWCEAASSGLPFDIMSHPDLAKKFGYYPSFDVTALYIQAAEAAASGGRMVEVNTSGKHYACKEMFPAPALLEAFCKAGVPCTVGTDAHQPHNVARGIEEGYRLMYECGYREVTVPTRSGERRRVTIG